MAGELLRSRENILSDLVRSILANSDLNDISPGSTLSILLDALSGTLYQNQLLVLKILESTSLETLTGIDLDRKAASIGLPDGTGRTGRRPSSTSSGLVQISSSFKQLNGKLYAGKPAPFAGSSVVYVEDASTWPASGSLYIGRGTASNLEGPIPYTLAAGANLTLYWQITLGGQLTKNHSLSESITVAQGGDRIIAPGTTVSTTPNANSPAILYTVDQQLLIPDGQASGTVSVTSIDYGSQTNATAGSINTFTSLPFVGAKVTNPTSFVSGTSTESDEDLRQRIRDYPATLARGTANAISAALLGLSDSATGKAISSVVVVEPAAVGEPSMVYINDGSLLEPSFTGQSYEKILPYSSGQETLFTTAQSPITPCVAIGAGVAPFALVDQETLVITIDGITETYKVTGFNYANLSSVSSFEIIRDFNAQSNICDFRTIDGGKSIVVFDSSGTSEIMTVASGDLQAKLGLPTSQIRPIYLYKNSKLLSFKGKTATLMTSNYPWGNLASTDMTNVQVIVDGITQTFSVTNADFSQFFTTMSSATLANWATVLNKKISGVSITVVNNSLVWASYQKNSSNSSLEIPLLQAKPAAFFANAGLCTIVTAQNHGLLGSAMITINGSSLSNLDGTYLATVVNSTTFTVATTLSGSGVLFYTDPNSVNTPWIGVGKMWPAPTSLAPLSSQGSSQDYEINRYLGEIKLLNKPSVGDEIEIATQQTRAQIFANVASAGVYSIAPATATVGNSRMVVSFDGEYAIKKIYNSANSIVLVTPFPNERIIRLTAYVGSSLLPNLPDNQLFSAASVGDYLYISPDVSVPNPFGPMNPILSTCFLIKTLASDKTWIEFEVSSSEYTAFTNTLPMGYATPSPLTYNVTSLMFNLFSSTTTPQVVDFGSASTVTVDTAISIINSQIKSGSAQKLSSTEFVLRGNSYMNGSVAVLAVIGNAQNMFSTDVEQNIQPHQASIKSGNVDASFPVISLAQRTNQLAGKPTRGYLKSQESLTNIISTGTNPTIQADSTIAVYPLGSQEIWVTGKLTGYTGRTYHLNQTAPYAGFLRTDGAISNISEFDTTTSPYNSNDYRNISIKCQAMPFSITDKLVFELDLDDVAKTVAIPMAKKAMILSIDPISGEGEGQTINCQLADPDDLYGVIPSPRPFFNQYSPFQTFNLEDFRVLTKSVGVYKVTGADRAIVLRSTSFGATSRLKFSIRYPLSANQSTLKVSHKAGFASNTPETYILAYLTSGSLAQAINSGTLTVTAVPSGGLASITFSNAGIDPSKFTVGNIFNFGGNHVLSGAYQITASGSGYATVLAPSYLSYSTVPVTGLTLSTQSSSPVVEVSQSNHGYSSGDYVNITAPFSCNGISAANLSVNSAQITVIDNNNYTYSAASSASGPATGSMTASFAGFSRTLTVNPGTAVVNVSHTAHNLITGDQINIASAPSGGIGGIPESDLEITNAFVTYVNANSYSYAALSSAPSQSASILVGKTAPATFATSIGSSLITATQAAHGYTSGATLTFSGVTGTPGGISASLINIQHFINVLDTNTYTFTVGALATSSTTGNPITASYSSPTGTLTVVPGSSTVKVTLVAGHYLASGATVNLTALSGAGGLTTGQLTAALAPVIVLNSTQFTYVCSAAAPAITGSATVSRSNRTIAVSIPNGFQTVAGVVNVTDTNHRFLATDHISFTSSTAIGGISAANLSVANLVPGSSQLSINGVNSYSFIALAASPTFTTTVSVVKPLILSCTQYPISTYPVVGRPLKDIADAINAYLPANPVATAQAIGTGTATNLITDPTYITYPQSIPFSSPYATMETNYDYHSFACKYSGYGDIYTYPQPSQFATLADYIAATTGNAVQLLVQTVEGLFPTSTESSPTPYTPAGEVVYIVPTNAKTLNDWLSFPAISSLSVLSTIEPTNSLTEIQVSSKLQGFSGAVQVKGVTANSATMFVNGVGTTVYDPAQIDFGGFGATQVSTGYAATLPFVAGTLVKVQNNQTSELLRPYRTTPIGSAITGANDIDPVHFFRKSTEVSFIANSATSTRIMFKRYGIGTAQTEPLQLGPSDLISTISVNFYLTEIDGITALPAGIVRMNISDPTNIAYFSARTGDMMFVRGSTVKSLVSAVQQGAGSTTVRYTFAAGSSSEGIVVGQSLVVNGFANSANNSTLAHPSFLVVALTNTYVDLTNAARTSSDGLDELAAVGASLNFGSTVPAYTSPFPSTVQCQPITKALMTDLEYIGYPVVNVYDQRNILITAPNITAPLSVTIPNTNAHPEFLSSLVFMPAIYNEKNILTNRSSGPKYQEMNNNGNMNVIVKTLSNGFVAVWVSNSSAGDTDTMKLEECGVNTDDWITFGTDFALANQGTYKLIAHNGSNQIIIYNPNGGQDELISGIIDTLAGTIGFRAWGVGPFTSNRPIRVVDSESVRIGDLLRISSPTITSTWFPSNMIGSFPVLSIGYMASTSVSPSGTFDPTMITPYVDIALPNGPIAQTTLVLGSNVSAVGFTAGSPVFGFREFIGYTVNSLDATMANVYLQPDLNNIRMSSTVGTQIDAIYKMNYSTDVVRGVDAYSVFSGLIALAHHVIDGVSTDSSTYPGVRAAGTQVEVLTPLLKSISLQITLSTKNGVDKSIVSQISQSTIAGYVNALAVGQPVILSEIIATVQNLAGVYSVEVSGSFPAAVGGKISVGNFEKCYVLDALKDIVVS